MYSYSIRFNLSRTTKRFLLSISLFSIFYFDGISQCQISTNGGAICRSENIEVVVSTTNQASYTALRSDGKKVGNGQGNGGSISLMFLNNGGTYFIIGRKDECIEISNQAIPIPLTFINEQKLSTAGTICEGVGTTISMLSSQQLVTYELRLGGILVQTKEGTGNSISFDPVFSNGTYSIWATAAGCNPTGARLTFGNVIVGD